MSVHRLTEGAIDFAAWLESQPRKGRQVRVAALLGTSQQTVSKIALGRLLPASYELVEALSKHCGIAPKKWHRLTRFHAPPVARERRRDAGAA